VNALTPAVWDFVAQNHNYKLFFHKTRTIGVITCNSGDAGVQPLGSPEPSGTAKFFTNLLFVIASLPKD
jgi:hypothetical protein